MDAETGFPIIGELAAVREYKTYATPIMATITTAAMAMMAMFLLRWRFLILARISVQSELVYTNPVLGFCDHL